MARRGGGRPKVDAAAVVVGHRLHPGRCDRARLQRVDQWRRRSGRVRLVLKVAISAFLLISVPTAVIRLFIDFRFESLTLALVSPLLAWWIIGGTWGFGPRDDRPTDKLPPARSAD